MNSHFPVRTCADRLAEDGATTMLRVMADVPVPGIHTVEIRDARGKPLRVHLELRYRRVRIRPPSGKKQRYGPLD